MSARFAEICREKPLDLDVLESAIANNSQHDGRAKKDICLVCERDLHLGIFFDGTNNNKYRDIPTNSASNVARLFESFIGSPAESAATYGGEKSKILKSASVSALDFAFYRKIYVPGVGTAFPEIHDPGENKNRILPNAMAGDKTRGLAFAAMGLARIQWAMLQVLNQVHLMFTKSNLDGLNLDSKWAWNTQTRDTLTFNEFWRLHNQNLAKKLAPWRTIKPTPRVLRLSVFGFSRGAAQARAFVNMLLNISAGEIGGIRLKIDMLGIFDTVASVGLAHITNHTDGHMAWADGEKMVIPSAVRRCVHLVSAHEVRMCFPLDSVGQNGHIPSNCKEIVYPGVHSDVGGGYGLNDQGRCPSDDAKISQISLAQMYREARMAAVPLVTGSDMPRSVSLLFKVNADLIADFNEYVKKTQQGFVDPSKNTGQLQYMYPTETQPAEPLLDIMHRHYGFYLLWRKYRLDNIHKMPSLKKSRPQDTYDIWQANELLKEELKPNHLDDLHLWIFNEKSPSSDDGFVVTRELWNNGNLNSDKDLALIRMFDRYVHDSRAWFKLDGDSDDEWFGGGKDANGEIRKSKKDEYTSNLARIRQFRVGVASDPSNHPSVRNASAAEVQRIDKEVALYKKWGDTLLVKGESAQEGLAHGAGYMRWRTVYSTTDSRRDTARVRQYDLCVLNRAVDLAKRKKDLIKLEGLLKDQELIVSQQTGKIESRYEALRAQKNDKEMIIFRKHSSELLKNLRTENEKLATRIKFIKKQLEQDCGAMEQ